MAKQLLEDHQLSPNLERFMTVDARLPVGAIVEEVLGLHPVGWTLVRHTTKTILRLAGLGLTILVGRGACADVITAILVKPLRIVRLPSLGQCFAMFVTSYLPWPL